MGKHKSYNPFKMWGSYVGGFFGAIVMIPAWLISYIKDTGSDWELFVNNFPSLSDGIYSFLFQNGIILSLILYTILGFVIGGTIGWGIHSLVRKLK